MLADREVLVQRLKQDQPGQLGKIARMMAEAGVNIEVIYSDHQNQLILVVNDLDKGRAVCENWKRESTTQSLTTSDTTFVVILLPGPA